MGTNKSTIATCTASKVERMTNMVYVFTPTRIFRHLEHACFTAFYNPLVCRSVAGDSTLIEIAKCAEIVDGGINEYHKRDKSICPLIRFIAINIKMKIINVYVSMRDAVQK